MIHFLPISFILCLNHLSLMFDQALYNHHLKPISLGCHWIPFNHVIFCGPNVSFCSLIVDCSKLFKILSTFCLAFGQLFSTTKSKLFFSPNISETLRVHICIIIDIHATTNFGKYLGTPLLTERKSLRHFSFLVDHTHSCMQG